MLTNPTREGAPSIGPVPKSTCRGLDRKLCILRKFGVSQKRSIPRTPKIQVKSEKFGFCK